MWWQPLSPRTPDAKLSRWRWSTLFEPFTSSLLFDCICFFLNKERLSKQWKDRGHKRRGKMRRRKAKEGQCGNSWRLLYVWREKALRTQEIGLAYFGLGALGISVTVGWNERGPRGAATDGGQAVQWLLRSKLGEKPFNKMSHITELRRSQWTSKRDNLPKINMFDRVDKYIYIYIVGVIIDGI